MKTKSLLLLAFTTTVIALLPSGAAEAQCFQCNPCQGKPWLEECVVESSGGYRCKDWMCADVPFECQIMGGTCGLLAGALEQRHAVAVHLGLPESQTLGSGHAERTIGEISVDIIPEGMTADLWARLRNAYCEREALLASR